MSLKWYVVSSDWRPMVGFGSRTIESIHFVSQTLLTNELHASCFQLRHIFWIHFIPMSMPFFNSFILTIQLFWNSKHWCLALLILAVPFFLKWLYCGNKTWSLNTEKCIENLDQKTLWKRYAPKLRCSWSKTLKLINVRVYEEVYIISATVAAILLKTKFGPTGHHHT
jgi:hypothetical protein